MAISSPSSNSPGLRRPPRPLPAPARAAPPSGAELSPSGSAPGDWLYHVRALGRRMARFWRTAVIVLIVGGAAAGAGLPRILPPVYRSETVLLYREGIQADRQRGEGDSTKKLGPRLKDMLLARTRLERIVDELGLYPRTVARYGKIDAVEELRSHIDFKAREGDTFHITFDGESPALAYAVTTKLADGLVEENARLRVEQAAATKLFLEGEKARVDDELRAKERDLAKFLADHPEFADETGGKGGPSAGASVRAQEKREKEAKTAAGANPNTGVLAALERQASRLRERIRNPSAPPPPPVVNVPPPDPKLVAAKSEADAQLASAQRELADKQTRFTDQHPDVVAARSKVKGAEAKAQAAAHALESAQAAAREKAEASAPAMIEAPADVDALKSQLGRVERDIIALRNGGRRADPTVVGDPASEVANSIVALETAWSRLNRDVLEARERNQQLVDRLFKASMAANVETAGGASQMVVVDPAYVPARPFSFGKARVAAAGIAVAAVLGLIAALLRALFDQRVYDDLDVERLDLGALAGTPGGRPLVHAVPRRADSRPKGKKVKS